MIQTLFDSGVALILYLQSLGDWIFPPMRLFTFLGTIDFYMLLLPLLYWSIDASLGLRVGVILLLSGSLNGILKWAFHLPRPYWIEPRVQGLWLETSFGAPSGHAQNPLAIFGLMAAALRRGWAWALAGALIFLVGFSRLVLGVHFYFDLGVGWLVGGLLLWAFLRFEAPVRDWFERQSFGWQVGSVLLVSLALILAGALVLAALGGFQLPQAWVQNALADQPEEAIAPLDLSDLITPAAALFGLGSGYLWLARRGGFHAGGEWWKRVVRFVLGVIGVLLLAEGLGAVFPRGASLLSYSLRFVRYGLVGFWVTGLAPWTFLRLGLAGPSQA